LALGLALLVQMSCSGSAPSEPNPGLDATIVQGTERLGWSQSGNVSGLTFRAYVDDTPVTLMAATCDTSMSDAACTSPLPPLANGVHTIALTSVLTSDGLESERSEALTVQKVSATTTGLAALPDAMPSESRVHVLAAPVRPIGGFSFSADIVARGILAPAQLAATPDGRLLVAEADGGVRIVHPGLPAADVRALASGGPDSTSTAPLGLAIDPDFELNHFIYAASLTDDGPDHAHLRVMRFREWSDTLSEPSAIFEARAAAGAIVSRTDTAPRLAFGPDGLLYIALPLGLTFVDQPTASAPDAAMLRITAGGQLPSAGPIAGMSAHPLGFTWHPSTGALWLALPEQGGTSVIRAATTSIWTPAQTLEPLRLPMTYRTGQSPALFVRAVDALATQELARAFMAVRRDASPSAIRLTIPVATSTSATGGVDAIGDIVSPGDGMWFAVTSNATRAGGDAADGDDVIVRLRLAAGQ
jgi:hypothetical protein